MEKIIKVIERAKDLNLIPKNADRMSIIMDIDSAEKHFNLDFEKWLESEDFDFAHDFIGIERNICRDRYPATNFNCFVPRCARG